MTFCKKNQLHIFIWLAVLVSTAAWASVAQAAESDAVLQNEINIYNLKLDEATLSRGYTATIFDNNFRVGIFPEVLEESTDIVFKEFLKPEDFLPMPLPSSKKIVSPVFEFDIRNSAAFKNQKPLIIEIKYPEDSVNLKKINFWDKGKEEWVELPSKNIVERNVIRAPIHLPYARLAIFEDPNIMEVGLASWYVHKSCNCAASPDWPKGSQLKVTNLSDNSSVIVTVNDYGPDRSVHPDRVIDLDVTAFKKIAMKWMGLIKVMVEKL
jgi:hypothetical protein